MIYFYIPIICVIVFVIYKICFSKYSPRFAHGQDIHVLITGGSSGIGKAIAIELVKYGFSITLLARNQEKLNEAKFEIEKLLKFENQKISVMSVDVSKDYTDVENVMKKAEEINGPVKMLFNCAGTSIPGRFEDLPINSFKELMDLNYLGSVFVTRAVISSMKKEKQGIIVFTSSQAGQLGICGFTAYSASKFALRGFAESLQMEVKPFNISVTVSYPPDTNTPGLAKEQELKPPETKAISETAGVFEANYVAKRIIEDALLGKFTSYIGVDGWMLSIGTAGMSPPSSFLEAFQQVLLMGILRLIGIFYLLSFDRIIKKHMVKNKKDS